MKESESAEQQARNLLDRMEIEGAQFYSAGELVELANLISEVRRLRAAVGRIREMATGYTPSPDLVEDIADECAKALR